MLISVTKTTCRDFRKEGSQILWLFTLHFLFRYSSKITQQLKTTQFMAKARFLYKGQKDNPTCKLSSVRIKPSEYVFLYCFDITLLIIQFSWYLHDLFQTKRFSFALFWFGFSFVVLFMYVCILCFYFQLLFALNVSFVLFLLFCFFLFCFPLFFISVF